MLHVLLRREWPDDAWGNVHISLAPGADRGHALDSYVCITSTALRSALDMVIRGTHSILVRFATTRALPVHATGKRAITYRR